MVTDPVCHMQIDESKAVASPRGKTYHFCAAGCKKKFDENPLKCPA